MIEGIVRGMRRDLAGKVLTLGVRAEDVSSVLNVVQDVIIANVRAYAVSGKGREFVAVLKDKGPIGNHILVQSMVMDLTFKLYAYYGIHEPTAGSIARFVIPYVMNRIGHSLTGPDDEQALLSSMHRYTAIDQLRSFGRQFRRIMAF